PELLLLISEKRGFKDDYERASEMLILELRQGKLGRFTLDRYEELSD
ncbi:MAG: ribosome biogenesis GTPase YlqF, partial [Enterococcus sp.]